MIKIRIILLAVLVIFTVTNGLAQKKKKHKSKEREVAALKLYDGDELPAEQVVRLKTETVDKKYAYFIAVDEKRISNNSLVSGPQEIIILPGIHKIQMRFVAKGEIAIPVEPFDSLMYEAGKTYLVRFDHTPGKGSYLHGAGSTWIKLWIELLNQPQVLMEKTVDGFGKEVN